MKRLEVESEGENGVVKFAEEGAAFVLFFEHDFDEEHVGFAEGGLAACDEESFCALDVDLHEVDIFNLVFGKEGISLS